MGLGNRDVTFDLMLLKAKALAETGNPRALDTLHILQEREPECLEIKRMIGKVCFENNLFEEAAESWMMVYLSTDSLDSLKYVICSVLYTETFGLLFNEWKIQRHVINPAATLVIEMILAKKEFFNLDKFIRDNGIYQNRKYSFSMEEICAARRAAVFSREMVLRLRRGLGRNRGGPGSSVADGKVEKGTVPELSLVGSSAHSIGPTALETPAITNDQFYVLYQSAIQLLEHGDTAASLDILLDLYRQETREGLLCYLAKNEKWEILFYLGRASAECRIYYELVAEAMRNAKVRAFHAFIAHSISLPISEEIIDIL